MFTKLLSFIVVMFYLAVDYYYYSDANKFFSPESHIKNVR